LSFLTCSTIDKRNARQSSNRQKLENRNYTQASKKSETLERTSRELKVFSQVLPESLKKLDSQFRAFLSFHVESGVRLTTPDVECNHVDKLQGVSTAGLDFQIATLHDEFFH
jgi:hypothetical protein